jgi:hypothetical protein
VACARARSVGRRLDAARLYARAAIRFRSPGNAATAVGALFGQPGMRTAARLLRAPHLVHERSVLPAPDWVAARAGSLSDTRTT